MQTLEGGKKTVETMILKHGSYKAWCEWMAIQGAKGGQAKVATKGFGKSREWASECGRKGGSLSRRGRKWEPEPETEPTPEPNLLERIFRKNKENKYV